MKKQLTATMAFIMAIGSLLIGTAGFAPPVGAELSSTPQTSWGVQGLLTGTETDLTPSEVFALEQVGSVMYVGGRFTEITNGVTTTPQVAIAAFDANTGDWISTFTPVLDGAVYALQGSPDGSRLFVGGDFENVNGVPTGGLVALDPTTGAIDTSWTGKIGGYNVVRSFDIGGSWLYVAGGFTSISSAAGGNAAWRVARFALGNGVQDSSWRPVIAGGTVRGLAVSPDMDRVYLAGSFTTSNGAATPGGFVALQASTPANAPGVQPFNVNTQNTAAQYNFDVLAVNGLVFVAGSQHYLQVLNESDLSLQVFHRSSIRGDYQGLTLAGDRVYAGSHSFGGSTLESANGVLWVGPPPPGESDAPIINTVTNGWLTAFSATTGLHVPGSTPPINTSGAGIWAVTQASDTCIWAGGAVSSVGGTPQWGFTRLCDTALIDTQRPSTPKALTNVVSGPDSVDLSWTASTDNFGVTGYNVYDAATNQIVTTTPTNSASVAGLAPGTHSFYVKAFDAASNLSWRSNITTTSLVDDVRPSTPTALAATVVASDSVDLSWTASTDNFGVTGYFVYDAATGLVVADVTGPTASFTGLPFTIHRWYVKAYDAAGNLSYRSNTVVVTLADPNIDTERPSVPTGLAVVAVGSLSAEFSWMPSTDNVGVAGYRLYDNATNTVVADIGGSPTTLSGLTPGTHSYYIKAYDAAGNLSWRSGAVSVTIADPAVDTQRPSKPAGLTVTTVGVDFVDLAWTGSTDNVAVVGYRIFNNATGLVVADVPGLTATIGGLAAGNYNYYVKAYDAAGNLSWRSNIVTVTIP